MATSVEDLVRMLNGTPAPSGGGSIPGATSVIGVGPVHFEPGVGYVSDTTGMRVGGAAVGEPGETRLTPQVGGRVAGQPYFTPGAGELNVPYGAEYLSPALKLYASLLGEYGAGSRLSQQLAENARQFNVTAQENAARALANLRAQGPQSAAELAFLQAGMGLPAIGGSAAAIENLIGASTRGATGSTSVAPGGQTVSIPNTLSGAQLTQLAGNPNLAGVLQSFAQASGNPDVLRRSIEALIPHGYGG